MNDIALYLMGCLICIIISARHIYKDGVLMLEDVPTIILVTLCSWLSIIFYIAYKIVCCLDEHISKDKVLWKRKDKEDKQ